MPISNFQEAELEEELRKTREELEVERKLNQELKKLMVASMAEELQGQVEALTEDKIRLAHRVEEYAEKVGELLFGLVIFKYGDKFW